MSRFRLGGSTNTSKRQRSFARSAAPKIRTLPNSGNLPLPNPNTPRRRPLAGSAKKLKRPSKPFLLVTKRKKHCQTTSKRSSRRSRRSRLTQNTNYIFNRIEMYPAARARERRILGFFNPMFLLYIVFFVCFLAFLNLAYIYISHRHELLNKLVIVSTFLIVGCIWVPINLWHPWIPYLL